MVTCAAPLCGPTCLPFSIVLSGVTGVAARHGAPLGFEKAWRAAAASSLPSLPSPCHLRLSLSRVLFVPRDFDRTPRASGSRGMVVFFFFTSPLCHHHHHPPRVSILPPLISSSSNSRSVLLVFFFFPSPLFSLLLFSFFPFFPFFFPSSFFLSFKMNACARAQVQRGQLDGLQR